MAPILSCISSQDSLRSITFRLVDASKHDRGQFLLELSSRKVDEILARFPKLQSLSFRIPERPGTGVDHYSADRWETMLYTFMPKLRGVVTVSVMVDQHRYYGCWANDLISDANLKRAGTPKEDNDSGVGDSSDERSDLDGDEDVSGDDSAPDSEGDSPLDQDSNDDVEDQTAILERTVRGTLVEENHPSTPQGDSSASTSMVPDDPPSPPFTLGDSAPSFVPTSTSDIDDTAYEQLRTPDDGQPYLVPRISGCPSSSRQCQCCTSSTLMEWTVLLCIDEEDEEG
ncbi:hypothetical protein L226DRAFT_353271 [Lentinus tigrinus ALCF2SS1-7]|uniref:uncharacterized protein n=1 Tax=Lentinus tigrinus ALCF2SS1-7 TaxID=1328758 RepID=UPI001165E445|nr:hypothetical protein L226DRAFT_353271 [Lentinus tigrinus ALCF2SS1-7]